VVLTRERTRSIQEGTSSTLPRIDVPRWLVSAQHRMSRQDDAGPFGMHHAREVGAMRTACGEPALSWPYFWESTFAASPDACEACVLAVDGAPDVCVPAAHARGSADGHYSTYCACGHLLSS
jgi:hypothetical protein